MATVTTTSAGIARIGALLADETRAEVLCALMDGRAHTGSELSRHIGVAASTISEHLSKLLDADVVSVEAQGRHRYWRLADPNIAQLLESLGANATRPSDPKAPAALAHARTCYDHLAGELAVTIYEQLLADDHISDDDGQLTISPSGFDLFTTIGADIDAIRLAKRSRARPCLDWTQRRHHLAGAAGKELLAAFTANGWVKAGNRPRSLHITEAGRQQINRTFGLTGSSAARRDRLDATGSAR
jgi:DNA-binding transcriptional ArsR family regulator